jgi:hypothetical protein
LECGTVCGISRKFALVDDIGSHTCLLEATVRVTNSMPLRCPLPFTFTTMHCVDKAIDPALNGDFSMILDDAIPYTHKSQYMKHATLLGSNNANLTGNGMVLFPLWQPTALLGSNNANLTCNSAVLVCEESTH